tara:strand:+ start:278 stop:892 length:615 start_codon:yes stop_codon:yes gene_type:complete
MAVDEEIFNKEVEKIIKPKPKRKLTEKQLENLAKGRERMRLKREQIKLEKEGKMAVKVVKDSDKCAKKGQVEKRKGHKEKRRTLKEINKEKEDKILQRLEKQEADKLNKTKARLDLFTNLKVKCLQEAKSVKDYTEIKQALDGIDEDTLHDDKKLKEYARGVMSKFIIKTDKESSEAQHSEAQHSEATHSEDEEEDIKEDMKEI